MSSIFPFLLAFVLLFLKTSFVALSRPVIAPPPSQLLLLGYVMKKPCQKYILTLTGTLS